MFFEDAVILDAILIDEEDDSEVLEAVVLPSLHQADFDFRSSPEWSEIISLDRASDFVVSEEQHNPVQPPSYLILPEERARPNCGDELLQFPFPSAMIPVNRSRIGDSVLLSRTFSGDIS
jgi:hypothetical protein